jgi:hypothetical protein
MKQKYRPLEQQLFGAHARSLQWNSPFLFLSLELVSLAQSPQ